MSPNVESIKPSLEVAPTTLATL